MSFHSVSGIRSLVQIFPLEGGSYSVSSDGTPARVLTCIVQKDIRAPSGNFEIVLAPGGPTGVDGAPTWIDVLTPMSTVVIGMQRGDRSGVVLVGIVVDVTETTAFEEDRVIRTTTVVGKDIGYFWENFSFFSLTALGLASANQDAGQNQAFGAGATELTQLLSRDQNLSAGLMRGNPAEIAGNWYTTIMLNLLSNTYLSTGAQNTQTGEANQILFKDAVTEFIEEYPDFEIPFGLTYVEAEITFDAKMKSILEFPQYEVWYGTLPSDYPLADETAQNQTSLFNAGHQFVMPHLEASSAAVFVGRINPIPVLDHDFGSIDSSKWDALPLVTADSSYISCSMRFSSGEVANLYLLQSIALRQLYGGGNGSSVPLYVGTTLAVDIDSLQRFGYRPHWHQTSWLQDPIGTYSKDHDIDYFYNVFDDIMARVVSWYHPIPLMAHAEVTFPLLPDIFVGSKFEFNPKKYKEPWTFYIKSVTHDFHFGGPATTTLGLERGLPSSVYADTQGLLLAVYTGTAERRNGVYGFGPLEGLQRGDPLTDEQTELHLTIEDLFAKPQTNVENGN